MNTNRMEYKGKVGKNEEDGRRSEEKGVASIKETGKKGKEEK